MTTKSRPRRILKSADVASAGVLEIESDAGAAVVPEPAEPLLFTASETEALCETARQSGAEEALAGLGPVLDAISASMRQLAEETPESRSRALRADSATIIETSIAIARWVLGQELQNPDAVASLVEQALAEHDVRGAQRIRVAPELAEQLADLLPEDVEVAGDRSIPSGSFVLQTDGPHIGLSVDAALERARIALTADSDADDTADRGHGPDGEGTP